MAETEQDVPWKLALIVDDADAIKVAAAYYALPAKRRGDLDRLADVSGVTKDVRAILTRLDAAGMLQAKMPPILMQLIGEWTARHLSKK